MKTMSTITEEPPERVDLKQVDMALWQYGVEPRFRALIMADLRDEEPPEWALEPESEGAADYLVTDDAETKVRYCPACMTVEEMAYPCESCGSKDATDVQVVAETIRRSVKRDLASSE